MWMVDSFTCQRNPWAVATNSMSRGGEGERGGQSVVSEGQREKESKEQAGARERAPGAQDISLHRHLGLIFPTRRTT